MKKAKDFILKHKKWILLLIIVLILSTIYTAIYFMLFSYNYDTKVEYATPVAVADGVIENTDMILNTSVKAEKVLCYITSKDAKEINFGVTERILHGINLGDIVKIEKCSEIKWFNINNLPENIIPNDKRAINNMIKNKSMFYTYLYHFNSYY